MSRNLMRNTLISIIFLQSLAAAQFSRRVLNTVPDPNFSKAPQHQIKVAPTSKFNYVYDQDIAVPLQIYLDTKVNVRSPLNLESLSTEAFHI